MVTPQVKELVRNGTRVAAPLDVAALDLVALVEGARAGDARAWEQLVRRMDPLVRRIARGFRLADGDIDDVVQRTWLKLLENIHTIREPERLAGWLATTTRRMCLDVFQSHVREAPIDEIELPCGRPSPEDVVIAAERSELVRDAVETLPPRQRTLIALMTQGPERAYADIADVLQMPVGSIGPTYGRSVQRLREHRTLAQLAE